MAATPLGWGWVERCRALGGEPTLEMFEEAVAGGHASIPLLVDVLSRRSFREGEPFDCADLPVHAMRVLGEIRDASALPSLLGVLGDPVDPLRYGEEAAIALSRLGELVFPSTERVLADRQADTWVRFLAARTMAFAAVRDGALAARFVVALDRALRDPLEHDRELVSHLVSLAVSAGAPELVPAMTVAYASERVDRDVLDEYDVEREFSSRDGGPDPQLVELARRDPRELYRPWSLIRSGLDPEIAADIVAIVEGR